MADNVIDLKKEQRATLERPGLKHSFMARLFFFSFDLVTGRRTTLFKVKLLEILAGVPYRAWEIGQYHKLTRCQGDEQRMRRAQRLMTWAREARDNEYQHLLLLHEKIREDRLAQPWFLNPVVVWPMVFSYRLLSWLMAKLSLRFSIAFNAEFEDHAEHAYAEFVRAHPEWEAQPVVGPLAKAYGRFASWADLFRRVSLDERDHRNFSFYFSGRPQDIVKYEGMPEIFSVKEE
jgi:demethoxyubiquinone hydroxylase (CLK1/Coq7/Cat5 family)